MNTEKLNDALIVGDLDDALLAQPVEVAWGARRDDMRFANRKGSLGALVASLTTFERGPKDGKCLLPGALVDGGGRRRAENVAVNYLLMMDFDTGTTLDEAVEAIQARGLFAVVWTTHSHLKDVTAIPERALEKYLRKSGEWPGHIGDVHADECIAYLAGEKRYLPRVLEGATLKERKMATGGVHFYVAHNPLPRLRALFALTRPFDFANRGSSQKDAIEEWKGRYATASEELGLPWDSTCQDPSRLMYSPRIAPDAEIGEGAHEIIVLAGAPYDFEALPYTASRVSGSNTHSRMAGPVNAFTKAAANAGANVGGADENRERIEIATPGLASFLAKYKDFKAADWYVSLGNEPRHQHENGVDAECPNSDSHSTGDSATDRSFRILNGDDSGSWHALCLHEGCKSASGGDRWWYIDQACLRFGVGVDSLVEFSDTATAEAEKQESAEKTASVSRALGDDVTALREAIEALGPDASATAKTELIRALASRADGIETEELLEALAGALQKSVTVMRRLVKAEKRLLELAKPAPGEDRDDAAETPALPTGPDDPDTYVGNLPDYSDAQPKNQTVKRLLRRLNKKRPRLFERTEGGIVRLIETRNGTKLEPMAGYTHWLNVMADEIKFVARNPTTGETRGVMPTKEFVQYFVGVRDWEFPEIDRVVHVPILGPDGTLVTKKGYDENLHIYVDPDEGLLEAPTNPTEDEVGEAVGWLFEAIRDFPFSDVFDGTEQAPIKSEDVDADGFPYPNMDRGRSSRVNAIAMILQPFVRSAIDGPCPAFHVDKSAPGEGAGYLTDVAHIIFEGQRAIVQSMSDNDEEFRKAITATLRAGSSIIFIDNINRRVVSGHLAAALTAGVWRDRILGVSEVATIPIRATWIMAGNNVTFSHELMRRNIPIRLDSSTPRPAKDRGAKDFKHMPLQDWLMANRPKLVWACHVLIMNWVQQGMLPGTKLLNTFDQWSGTMSGIFEAAGIDGFLDNIHTYIQDKDEDENSDNEMMQALWSQFKEHPIALGDILDRVQNPLTGDAMYDLGLQGKDDDQRKKSLGRLLSKSFVGKTFTIETGGLKGKLSKVRMSAGVFYKITPIAAETSP